MPPHAIPDAAKPAGRGAFALDGTLYVKRAETGTFLASGGGLIEYWTAPGADPGWVALILNGTMRGALIQQRGDLALHAATFASPATGAALAVCGQSGAGKSTLGLELVRRGWLLIADDVSRVSTAGGMAQVWPGRPFLKLWRDACERGEIAVQGLQAISRDHDKYLLPVAAVNGPAPLRHVVELQRDGQTEVLSGAAKVGLLVRHSYRPDQIAPLGLLGSHLQAVARVSPFAAMLRLGKARQHSPAELADRVEAFAASGL